MCADRAPGRRVCRGVSLPELIFFIVVVGAGLAGVLLVLDTTVRKSADPLIAKQAISIAESLIDEITLKSYDSQLLTGPTRENFDDVDDYAGYATTGVQAMDGTPLPGLSGYNVLVSVPAPTTLNGVPAKIITVTITAPGGSSYSLSAYRTDY
jgi:MSHA pilin protein MshD